jgi:hypothetical protein
MDDLGQSQLVHLVQVHLVQEFLQVHHQTPEVHYQSHLLLEQAMVSKSVVELLVKE